MNPVRLESTAAAEDLGGEPDGLRGDRFARMQGTVALSPGYGALYNCSYRPDAQYDDVAPRKVAGRGLPCVPGRLLVRGDAPSDPGAWDRSIAAFRADLRAMTDLAADPETDLLAPVPHGQGRTICREALTVADQNAYHLGQLVTLRRLLGAWRDDG